jgi:hypothetical protein
MDITSALIVGSIVTYFMYQNINQITTNIESQARGSFESYAAFSAKIQEYIRKIKKDIDDEINNTDIIYEKSESCDSKSVIKKLNDLIRKASFYETVLAKRKTPKEVEKGFVDILEELDDVVKNSCLNGEAKALQLKEEIHNHYQKMV